MDEQERMAIKAMTKSEYEAYLENYKASCKAAADELANVDLNALDKDYKLKYDTQPAITAEELFRRAENKIIKKCVACGNPEMLMRGERKRCSECSGILRATLSDYDNRRLNTALKVAVCVLSAVIWIVSFGLNIFLKVLFTVLVVALAFATRYVYMFLKKRCDDRLSDQALEAKPDNKSEQVPPKASFGNCSHCGSPLHTRTVNKSVCRSLDNTRRVEQQVAVTQLYCKKCDLVANDDYHGDLAKASQRLSQLGSKPELDAPSRKILAQMMASTRSLAETSDADIEADFNSVRHSWDAVKILTIPAEDIESVLAAVVQGNSRENYSQIKLDVTDNKVLQINALGPAFRPYRILKTTKGAYAIYGHVTLYRFTGTT